MWLATTFIAVAPPFSLDDAHRMILYADAAYCGDAQHGSEAPIARWSCEPCKAVPGVRVLSVVSSPERQTLAFVAAEGVGGAERLVAAFRGSVLPTNFADDADQVLARVPQIPGRVHRGLYGSFHSLEPAFSEAMRDAIAAHPGAPIFVTGHSMGAAQAVYAAVALASNFTGVNVTAFGFGTPRPGDATFASGAAALPNLQAWAVAHRADIVPQCGIFPAPCGERALGYAQIPTNIWFPGNLSTPPMPPLGYRTCDGSGEDPSCQDVVPPALFNWDDHDWYLEHSMWCCAAGHLPGPQGCAFPFGADLIIANRTEANRTRSRLPPASLTAAATPFPAPFTRALRVSDPLMTGRDVTTLQTLLSRAGPACALPPTTREGFDSATAAALNCYAGTAALDADAANKVLALVPDGWVDDGAPAASRGYLYKILLPVHRNRSVETIATLLDSNNTALLRFRARAHGLDADASGRPITGVAWPDLTDAGCPAGAAAQGCVGLNQLSTDGSTPTGLSEIDLNSPEICDDCEDLYGPYPVNRLVRGLEGNAALLLPQVRNGILVHTGAWANHSSWTPTQPMPNSDGCIHAHPADIQKLWQLLVNACSVSVRPNTGGQRPYPYKPQGLIAVFEVP